MQKVWLVLSSSLPVAHMASAQHTAGGAASVGTAMPAGSSSGSDGRSSAGNGDAAGQSITYRGILEKDAQ